MFLLSIRDQITQEMCSDLVTFRAPQLGSYCRHVASKVVGTFPSDPADSHVSVINWIGEKEFGRNSTERALL